MSKVIHKRRKANSPKANRRKDGVRLLRLEKLEDRWLLASNILYRINAGGPALSADPAWQADTSSTPSPYSNASAGNTGTASTSQSINMSHPSIPAGTPMAVFQTARFDKPGAPNMTWSFPVTPGPYEVRLYLAETWSGAFAAGVRKFDVAIEGLTVLDDYDVFADVGALTGVVKTFNVTSDSSLDITFFREAQNPIINGIEIVSHSSTSISFGKSQLSGTTGLDRPTSLQFGPDGRLYVSQQNGLIRAYTVTRNGTNNYSVVAQENIALVQQIPNYNDDGTLNPSVNTRLVTGILVAGTAQNPVLYVTSSDPRIGGGSSGVDLNLDTNSSTVSRLTWTGTAWQKVDLVRGLPRSEENHAANGMQLDPLTNTLYVAMGGNTNMGAPSNNFSYLPEYALSAAILAIDLNAIGNTTYNLPTLDDESRSGINDANDPFGGNDGKNQAKLVAGGPVQVYAPGFRNPYDLVITSRGRMYSVDNGPNAGWGDVPIGEGPGGNATNQPNEPGVTYGDSLHFITGPGYYGGHPNPTRSNPNNKFNSSNPQSPVTAGNPIESDYRIPGVENGALLVFGSSTNGIAEYRTSHFGGAMQGNLIIASFDNTIKRVKLNDAGDQVVLSQNLFSNVGFRPLDVTVPHVGSFAGSIWVADIATAGIIVYEPNDGGGGLPGDSDGDCYSDEDEIANGTDPFNAADVPPDYDQDCISNRLDPDDDNDNLLDNTDTFAVDPKNGATTPVGTFYDWENEGQNLGGILGMGFTGLMTNGVDDYESLFDPEAVTAGGAAGVFTIDSALPGTARGSSNTQKQAFQFGVHVGNETAPFTAKSSVLGPFNGLAPKPGQEMGMFIGTGDQDNYVQIVLSGDNGGSVQLLKEVNGAFTIIATHSLPLPGPGFVDLQLTINPSTKILQASYSINGAAPVHLAGGVSIPAAWLAGTMAVGLISTDPTGSGAMPVTWDYLGVVSDAPAGQAEAFVIIDPHGGLQTASTFAEHSFRIVNNSTGNVRIQSVTFDTRTALLPDLVFDPTGEGGNDNFKPFTADSGAGETGLLGHTMLSPHDAGFEVLEVRFAHFDPGETFTFSIDLEPTSIRGSVAPGPSNSGKISGLELNGALVTVVFTDGMTTRTQTFRTPGSGRASQTTATGNLPPAPGLALLGSVAAPAVVFDAKQTLRITGPAGAKARLLRVESGLYLQGVPGGGFDIDPFEANKAIKLQEYVVTIGSSGFVDVPVTLTRSEPEAGLNYFVAAITDPEGRTGDVSEKIVLQLDDRPLASGAAGRLNIYPNGGIHASSTFSPGSFQVINQSTGGEQITAVRIDLLGSILPDVVFDPFGGAGDMVGKPFTPDAGAAETGFIDFAYAGPHDGGYDSLILYFNDFNPGETFTFSIDIDPTSIKGAAQPGPEKSGSISGLEASGASTTLHFSDGSTRTGQAFAMDGSKVNSHVILGQTAPAKPAIEMLGVPSSPTAVSNASQTIRISGPAGATARLLQAESALLLDGVPNGGFDIDPFETNKVIFVKHSTVSIGPSGFVDVAVLLNKSHTQGGVNQFLAVIAEADGRTSKVSNTVVVSLGAPPTGADGSTASYDQWKSSFGDVGKSPADSNENGVVDAADYVLWRRSADLALNWEEPEDSSEPAFAEKSAFQIEEQPGSEGQDRHLSRVAARGLSAAFVPRSAFEHPDAQPQASFKNLPQRRLPLQLISESKLLDQMNSFAYHQRPVSARWSQGTVAAHVQDSCATDCDQALEDAAWDAAFEVFDEHFSQLHLMPVE